MSTDWQDTSWQEEFLEMKAQKAEIVKLLLEGPNGFLDVLKLGSLHQEYKQLKRSQKLSPKTLNNESAEQQK